LLVRVQPGEQASPPPSHRGNAHILAGSLRPIEELRRTDDNTFAVCAVPVAALKIVLDAFAGLGGEPAKGARDDK
jgi:hypothetical protein